MAAAQRKKIRNLPCVYSGLMSGLDADGGISAAVDPAHLWPRGKGGCDDPLCVVPLERRYHRLFDEGKLDLLPALINGAYWPEIAHVIEAHQVSPTQLLERLTGEKWIPRSELEAAA